MDRRKPRRVHARGLATWLIPPMLLAGVAGGALFVWQGPRWVVPWALGALLAVVVMWVLVSVLWPAHADRRCAVCGVEALERIDADAVHGLVCRACGWRDESESAWLLAEDEEERLEDLVLQRRSREKPAGSPMDTPVATD